MQPSKYSQNSGSNIKVDSLGNFEARITITETELKHPRQSTEVEFGHIFFLKQPTLPLVTETDIDLPR